MSDFFLWEIQSSINGNQILELIFNLHSFELVFYGVLWNQLIPHLDYFNDFPYLKGQGHKVIQYGPLITKSLLFCGTSLTPPLYS